jgi:transposase InsO family protein
MASAVEDGSGADAGPCRWRLRAECLSAHWFLALADAAEKLEAERRYYNADQPHGAIGSKPPDVAPSFYPALSSFRRLDWPSRAG